MPRRPRLICVPYDTGHRGWRMGAGPDRLRAALAGALGVGKGSAAVEWIEVPDTPPPAEIRTAFELNRSLAGRVADAVGAGELPVVLAGNCITAVGTLAGLDPARPAVLWFDAHGDLNTPETTEGGFLDGMALAVATGRCWRPLAGTVPGFRPVPDGRVVLFAARDLDPAEREVLAASGIARVPPREGRVDAEGALERVAAGGGDAYLHLDLDALDPSEGRANGYAAGGGLSLPGLLDAVQAIRGRFRVRAVAFTAYDPVADPEGRIPAAAAEVLRALLADAAG